MNIPAPLLFPASTLPDATSALVGSDRAQPKPPQADKFHIVAMGGSAGSLEAIERFFQHLPAHSGMAFVVIVHQLPGQNGTLAQVVQHFTAMPVLDATDGLRVRPNHVYVVPADFELSLLNGYLLLLAPTQPATRRMPIDFFLESLAKDANERAVCIIFSGLGTDGSVGLKLVMENFGMVMVQDPATAVFDAMPRAALATEFVDFELAPEAMPAQLLDYVERPLLRRPPRHLDESLVPQPAHALQKIFALIRAQTGHDFSYYKRNTVFRRIERRMNAHQIREFTQYVRYLQENTYEVEQLFRELLIGVTKFFRDAEAFDHLKVHLRLLVQRKPAESTVRVWAPGCSTGEEAYSLAMLLLECIAEVEPERRLKLQIFATDISAESIDVARAATYPENITADVSASRLERFFQRTSNGYQIRKEVRDTVVFALHNINKDAPFTKLDLLCCRNLLIYLNSELQKNLLPVFHYALHAGGLLFLGPSENLTSFQDLFQPLDIKWKISRRTDINSSLLQLAQFPFALGQPTPPIFPPTLMANPLSNHRDGGIFAALVQKELLRSYAPPAVVINAKGEILYVNGRTGKYLEPAPGLSGMNLFDMAREKLNMEISAAVHRANQLRETVTVDNVSVETEVGTQLLRLRVQYLLEPEPLANLLLVSFEDQPTSRRIRRGQRPPAEAAEPDSAVVALNKELQYTKHRLQTTIEEMETSLEELKSTNEELQSANEELQSSNEEAMTNKEEMQSLNEELMTLNMQYMAKSEELGQAANDMKNLLDATDIAIIFLDNDMVIKRFTPPVTRIINLMPSDIGRPITHFASNLRYEHLLRDVQQVLDRLTSLDVNIQKTSGEWYTMRILPYRTLDNYISGAVITFTENTSLKSLETQLHDKMLFMESVQSAVQQPVLTLDEYLRISYANQAFADLLDVAPTWLRQQSLSSLGVLWNTPALREQLHQLLDANTPAGGFDDLSLEVDLPGWGRRRLVLYGRPLRHLGQPTGQALLGVQRVEEPG